MLAVQLAALAVTLYGVLTLAANLRRLIPAEAYPLPDAPPSASILVPARDEEQNIEVCVRSLLGQDYPDFEVVALDDGSTDETGAILERLAASEPRLRVIRGTPLPDGWLGKPWACCQLADAARGTMLLFTDADTRHGGHSLAAGVANALAEDADMLTGLPHVDTVTLGEQIVLPAILWSTATLLPLPLAYRLRSPSFSTANGQYMLFRRAAYEAVGGHGAVRDQILEDMMLARLVKAADLRWRMSDVSDVVSTRMYRDLGEILAGLGKTLFGVFDYAVVRFLVAGAVAAIVFLLPPAVVAAAALGRPLPGASVPLAAATWLLTTVQAAAGYRRLDYPPLLALLQPLTMTLFMLVAGWSIALTMFGVASWKGRELPRVRLRWL